MPGIVLKKILQNPDNAVVHGAVAKKKKKKKNAHHFSSFVNLIILFFSFHIHVNVQFAK